MRTGALLACAVLVGCGKEDREIPMWVDGLLVEGDCQESYEAYDATTVLQSMEIPKYDGDPLSTDPNWRMEGLPDPVGYVAQDENTYYQVVFENMNFAQVPAVDFTSQQAVFVWAQVPDTCGLDVQDFQVNTKSDGGVVLDVTLFDESMNCDTSCGIEHKALVMVEITKDVQASFCRRIKPGCDPDAVVQ